MTVQTSPIVKYGAQVIPWNPADHDGVEETVESMRARMDVAWPGMLAAAEVQPVGETTDRYEPELGPHVRRFVRWTYAVGLEVPAYLLPLIDPEILGGYFRFDDGASPDD